MALRVLGLGGWGGRTELPAGASFCVGGPCEESCQCSPLPRPDLCRRLTGGFYRPTHPGFSGV